MARITVEDCLEKENNRFALVQLAAKRAKQILHGSRSLLTESKGNKAVVTALREIADGKVCFMTEEEAVQAKERERLDREREEAEASQRNAMAADQPRMLRPKAAEISDDDDDDDEVVVEKEPADEDEDRNGDGSNI